MDSKTKKTLLIIYIVTLLILVGVWAANGYSDTWLYVTSFLIVLSSWFTLDKKNKDQ